MIDYNNDGYDSYKPKGYPVRHRRKVPFEPLIKSNLNHRDKLNKILKMDRVLGSFVLNSEDYFDLINESYSSNTYWSVKIEGNRLTMDEVKKYTNLFTKGNIGNEKRNGPVQEIFNHLSSFFFMDRLELPWNLNTIKSVHAMLMKDVNPDVTPGEIRTTEASVNGTDGFEYFIPCPSGSIEPELNSLLDWVSISPYDAIATSIIFFHEFESIHPFKDGNGRTGRSLFYSLMKELGLKNCGLCKFEEAMLKNTELYYTLLAYTDSEGDYSPLIDYVTNALLVSYEEAVETFGSKDRLKDMDENSKLIIMKSKSVDTFTMSDACDWIPSLTKQTVRAKINQLIDMGILDRIGNTRSSVYEFKDPFKNVLKYEFL